MQVWGMNTRPSDAKDWSSAAGPLMPDQLEVAFVIDFLVGNLIALITAHCLQLYCE